MKTKYWILCLAGLFALCLGLSVFLFSGEQGDYAEVFSDGEKVARVDLRQDQVLRVETAQGGCNEITITGGKIGVTAASCPDHICMHRGMCSHGAQIVCLPNRLVIRFSPSKELDTAAG